MYSIDAPRMFTLQWQTVGARNDRGPLSPSSNWQMMRRTRLSTLSSCQVGSSEGRRPKVRVGSGSRPPNTLLD